MQNIIDINSNNFEREVLRSDKPVIVNFYSENCQQCEALSSVYLNLWEKYGHCIKFVKIFRMQNRDIAEKYNIKSSPTVMIFYKGNEVGTRLVGFISRIELKKEIEKVIGENAVKCDLNSEECDVLIIGGGPAGLSAGIYSSRAKLNTIVIDEMNVGGQVSTTMHVANYPGTNGVVRGTDLMGNMKKQALNFGTKVNEFKQVIEVELSERTKRVKTEDAEYSAKTVIIASGAQPRKLPAEGESKFRGKGVHYCASCDGAFYQDKKVIVVGGGNSAVEEAVFLTRFASHVTIVHILDKFEASKIAQDEVFNNPNIDVIWNSEVIKIDGNSFVESVKIKNNKTNEEQTIDTDGVFVYIGMEPKTELFKTQVNINKLGYIITDDEMKTNVEGVFAVGDVRDKKIRQIATAVNDGVIAGINCEKYIMNKQS